MITLTRNQARRFRAVFRRSTLGINHRGVVSELVFRPEDGQLRAQHRYADLAVEHVDPILTRSVGVVALPLDALADFEGAPETPVTIEAAAPDRTIVRWDDRGIPQVREYALVTPADRIEPVPALPTGWTTTPGELLDALTEATETATDDSTRYALNCLQLQGRRGQIVATDGRQLLVRSGFAFPWDEDLLIRARPIFGCRAIPRDRPIEVSRTETHLVLRAGPWTLWCAIQREARFPQVDRVIPQPSEVVTRLQLEDRDARFLQDALGRLPGGGDVHAPVTIELNGEVAVRAISAEGPQRVTELVLDRSSYTGAPASLCTNRVLLERALIMGFREVGLTGVESPFVCREGGRTYAVQPLSGGSPPPEDAEIIRIESASAAGGERRVDAAPEAIRRDLTVRESRNRPEPSRSTEDRNSRPAGIIPSAGTETPGTNLATLIQEAESLHAALADMKSRSARLVAGLRRQRKQTRLLNETLKSLRQLKLVEAAG